MKTMQVLFAALAVASAISLVAGGRALQQAPQLTVPQALQVAGTSVSFPWHAVGVQNYTAGPGASYATAGALAQLFKETGPPLVGVHFFQSNGAGLTPVFTKIDPTSGETTGVLTAQVIAQSPAPAQQTNDGGFGSVNNLLLKVTSASGTLAAITFVQRINSIGGEPPSGLTGIAGFDGIPADDLSVPYAADYLFLVNGTGSSPPPSTSPPAPSSGTPCFCEDQNGVGYCFEFVGAGVSDDCSPTGRSNCQQATAAAGQFTTQGGPVFQCSPASSG